MPGRTSGIVSVLTVDVQWMMIAALPLLLSYNNRPGPRTKFSKYFFYVFYPLHIFILYGVYLLFVL